MAMKDSDDKEINDSDNFITIFSVDDNHECHLMKQFIHCWPEFNIM